MMVRRSPDLVHYSTGALRFRSSLCGPSLNLFCLSPLVICLCLVHFPPFLSLSPPYTILTLLSFLLYPKTILPVCEIFSGYCEDSAQSPGALLQCSAPGVKLLTRPISQPASCLFCRFFSPSSVIFSLLVTFNSLGLLKNTVFSIYSMENHGIMACDVLTSHCDQCRRSYAVHQVHCSTSALRLRN